MNTDTAIFHPRHLVGVSKNHFTILIYLLFAGQLFAQSGCGGGLQIGNFYNEKLEKINIHTNTSLKIRNFVLDGEAVFMETLPASDFLAPTRNINKVGDDIDSNQKMYIVYKKDTMIVDFNGIIGENSAGIRDRMDSLVIQKGYFKYNLSKINNKPYNYGDSKKFENGLTLHNTKELLSEGYLEYNPTIDLSFLSDKNQPTSFFIKRAKYYLLNNQTELALTEIKKGIKKNNNIENCEILDLLYNIYTKTGQYEKAIENISKAANNKCNNHIENRESNIANLRTRIELFIKLKQYNKALEDFNSLYTISKNKIGVNIERANFKIKYLQDYKGAINDLKTTIDLIPNNSLSNLSKGLSEYSNTYFLLAKTEYQIGDKKSAFKHWLKAEELGYGNQSSDSPIIYFNSIINQNPKVPELIFIRGLAYFKRGPYLGWGEDSKKCFNNALNDFNKAEELGMQDYKVNMYRASVLNQLEKYDEAMKEIDLAISKNKCDPQCFLIRYNLRDKLGQINLNEENDTDYEQYQILSHNWKWEKY